MVTSKSRRSRVFEETHLGGAVHGILLEVLLFAKRRWGGMEAVSPASRGRSRAALGTVAGRWFEDFPGGREAPADAFHFRVLKRRKPRGTA